GARRVSARSTRRSSQGSRGNAPALRCNQRVARKFCNPGTISLARTLILAFHRHGINKLMAGRKNTRSASPAKLSKRGARHDATARAVPDAAQTSARSSMGGPARATRRSDIADAATAKQAGTQAVASAFPHNAAKPSEFDAEAAAGQTVEPP